MGLSRIFMSFNPPYRKRIVYFPRPQAPHLKYVTLIFENLGFNSEIFFTFGEQTLAPPTRA